MPLDATLHPDAPVTVARISRHRHVMDRETYAGSPSDPLAEWRARWAEWARRTISGGSGSRGNEGPGGVARMRRAYRRAREIFGIYSEPLEATEPRIHLLVSGRVQGVGFRAWVLRRALELGLRGWVRNCRDGSVELEAAGPPHLLHQLRELVNDGPPLARVVAVEESQPRWGPLAEHFEIR
jgi:acylphosphatase